MAKMSKVKPSTHHSEDYLNLLDDELEAKMTYPHMINWLMFVRSKKCYSLIS
jgi:hypothetical protein